MCHIFILGTVKTKGNVRKDCPCFRRDLLHSRDKKEPYYKTHEQIRVSVKTLVFGFFE